MEFTFTDSDDHYSDFETFEEYPFEDESSNEELNAPSNWADTSVAEEVPNERCVAGTVQSESSPSFNILTPIYYMVVSVLFALLFLHSVLAVVFLVVVYVLFTALMPEIHVEISSLWSSMKGMFI